MALSTISGTTGITDATITSAKLADFSAAVDLNGVELLLDADQDTSITADTDDRIDFKIAGVEHFSFSNSSGDTIIKPMVDAKDIKFQQFDGRTLLDINDGGFVGIANGATGAGAIRIFEDTDNGSNYVGLTAGSIGTSLTFTLPTADGSSGQFIKTDGSGALSFDTVSSAADDITAGDSAVTIATSSGNITIDAQGSDTDIIFKGTDGSSDITPMTLDMSAGGDLFLTGGLIDLKNDGSAVSQIKFYCESSNAHAQTLIGAPHSEAASNTLTLPGTGGNARLVSTASTATLTNKTLTTPVIAEIDATGDFTLDAVGDIILDAGGGDFSFKDDGTEILKITNSSSDVIIKPIVDTKDIIFQQRDGTEVARIEDNATFNVSSAGKFAYAGTAVTSTAAELNILDGVTSTAAELNIVDGNTSATGTTIADADRVVLNDNGTMVQAAVTDLKTYIGAKVLQVVETSYTTAVAFNVSDFSATGVTASITPSASSSKVFVMVKLDIGSSNGGSAEGAKTRLYRGGSNIAGAMGADASSRLGSFITHPAFTGDTNSFITHFGQYLDSPSSTSELEYKIYIRGYDNSGSYPVYFNRSHSDSDNATVPRGVCRMTLMEIAG
jgi:hypothetical protein